MEVVHGATLVSLVSNSSSRGKAPSPLSERPAFSGMCSPAARNSVTACTTCSPRCPSPWCRVVSDTERVLADGTVDEPLRAQEVEDLVPLLRQAGVVAGAVCLLHSYRHPDHERLVGEVLSRTMPEVSVSLSSEVRVDRKGARGSEPSWQGLPGSRLDRSGVLRVIESHPRVRARPPFTQSRRPRRCHVRDCIAIGGRRQGSHRPV